MLRMLQSECFWQKRHSSGKTNVAVGREYWVHSVCQRPVLAASQCSSQVFVALHPPECILNAPPLFERLTAPFLRPLSLQSCRLLQNGLLLRTTCMPSISSIENLQKVSYHFDIASCFESFDIYFRKKYPYYISCPCIHSHMMIWITDRPFA